MHRVIGLKVDVDTFYGMKYGVPKISSILDDYNLKATFFIPMGKDRTGRTVKRVFTRRGFLAKARRIGVLKTYGIKNLLFGLILPGPYIAEKNLEVLIGISKKHEIGIHGYDHVFWHDKIRRMNYGETKRELEMAILKYKKLMGHEPRSFASPGWVTNVHALKILKEKNFLYSSDVRGHYPFYPVMEGESIPLIQIPTTLPTLDEVIGLHGNDHYTLLKYYERLLTDSINVMTIHAEIEGKNWSDFLKVFIEKTLSMGYEFKALIEIADGVMGENLPSAKISFGHIEGRAGEVCIQKFDSVS